jgi:hypothetical protein
VAIPETQLETWASQGAMAGSRDTYATIKTALEAANAPYAGKDFIVFLQGSYGNDTNIYAESDVDIVIQLQSAFHYGLDLLPPLQKTLCQQSFGGGVVYGFSDFKRDVLAHLRSKYGTAVTPGDKAITIAANGNRRKADVIVCLNYRLYKKFNSANDQHFDEGICFFDSNNTRIANYPKLHSANCTLKHQNTNSWYKPTVRIFKNMRNRMIAERRIEPGDAPSYFIEGMLYNVPAAQFGGSYENTVVNALNWLSAVDRGQLVTANGQYRLLGTDSVTWRAEKCTKFISAACDLWRQWP